MNIGSKFSRIGISIFSPHAISFRTPNPSYPILLSQLVQVSRRVLFMLPFLFMFQLIIDNLSVSFRGYDHLFVKVRLGSIKLLTLKERHIMAPSFDPRNRLDFDINSLDFGNRSPSINSNSFSPLPALARDLSLEGFPYVSLSCRNQGHPNWSQFMLRLNWRRNLAFLQRRRRINFTVHPDPLAFEPVRYFSHLKIFFNFMLSWSRNIPLSPSYLSYLQVEHARWRYQTLTLFLGFLSNIRNSGKFIESLGDSLDAYGEFFLFLVTRVGQSLYRPFFFRSLARVHRELKGLEFNISILRPDSVLSADFIASYIAIRFTRGFKVRQVITPRLLQRLLLFHSGIRLVISGRFSKKLRADYIVMSGGSMHMGSFSVPLDYAFSFGVSRFGCSGVKVWLGYSELQPQSL